MYKLNYKLLSFLLISIFSVVIFACSSDTETIEKIVEVEKEVPVTVVVEKEVEKKVEVMVTALPEETKPLVIYSGRGESLVQPLIDQFQATSGIEVQVNYGKTTALAATLLEEGSKTPADVYFAQDPGGLGSVDSMLSTLSSEVVAMVPEWASDPQGKWVGTSGRARVVVYNTDAVDPADLPASLEGFTDPKWKGRIAIRASSNIYRNEANMG